MIRRRSHPDSSVSTRRLEAYTDGVFAIAATLLVLDLTGRTITGVDTDGELWAALLTMWQPLLTFVVSFVILSMMWMTHVDQFEHISRIDSLGLWINNIRLLFVVLVPFSSSVLTDYSDLVLGRVLLPVNFFLVISCSWLQWAWATRTRERSVPDLSADAARDEGRGALSAVLISAGVVALSTLVGSWAFFLFVLDGWLTGVLRGRRATS
ncbi:MAG: TMEM175 family protein [Microbacterium sp.]|uniref:TMEM175 family protein n=1 Tax=Microbacterium sp. TaxID=51671 RepID=UPI0039E4A942